MKLLQTWERGTPINVDNKHTTDYRYDANGERICKYSDLGETIYASGYYTETDGKKISKHIYIGSTRVASQVMSRTCETSTTMKRENTLYYHTDHLGSSGYVTDKKGEFYEHTEYTSSGESWVNEKVTGNANLPYKYCLKEMDNETGLYYYGARYYDAKMSRFISADDRFDDLFSTQSMDIFAYCRNNPIIYIDPDGHAPIQDEKTQKIVTAEIDVSKYEDLKDLGDSNERALTVECTIESNIRNSSGRVIGMKGQQKITYIKSDGKKIEQTLENVIWQEDARVENPQYPYEMPAEPEDGFEIRKNNTSSFDDYPILTTHSETGICVHRDGRSEGCFLFDINKPEGAEALDDLHNRTVNQGEVLRGKVTCVTDKRTAAERRAAPVYYLNDPNYIIDTGD